jgi:hypothetical protein
MSELTDFMQSGFKSAVSTIGEKPFIIGSGQPIDIVNGEAVYEREWEMQGFDSEATLTVVGSSVDFTAEYPLDPVDYHGKKCTINGAAWKVGTLSVGDEFITINLVSIHQSS